MKKGKKKNGKMQKGNKKTKESKTKVELKEEKKPTLEEVKRSQAMDVASEFIKIMFTDQKETCFGFNSVVSCVQVNLQFMKQESGKPWFDDGSVVVFDDAVVNNAIRFLDEACIRVVFDNLLEEKFIELVENEQRDERHVNYDSHEESNVYRFVG